MQYDLIVIGSGPGGYVAAIRASQLGMKTAIVEREALGGICLNWGCIPTKALLQSASVFEYLLHAQEYGIQCSQPTVQFADVVKRSRRVADKMSKGVAYLMRKNKIDVHQGTAQLGNPGEVVVTNDKKSTTLKASHILIATGARAKALPHIPIDGTRVIGYREALTLPNIPKRMLIMGAGAIGVEFAYFYHTMGSKITIVEYLPQGLLPKEDADISQALQKIFTKKGMEVYAGWAVEQIVEKDNALQVTIRKANGEETKQIECDVVLSAVGIQPNTETLQLQQVGIQTDKNGFIQVDDYYRCSQSGYYAIGDVIPTPALAHVASAEGIICVEAIAGKNPEPLDYLNIPSCTYCKPEVASVGLTESAAREKGLQIKIGRFPYTASGKATAAGHNEGFVKLIFDDRYDELLGAHLIGYNVTEMISELIVAKKLETTAHEIIKAVHPHPTMSEAVMEAAAAAYDEVIHL